MPKKKESKKVKRHKTVRRVVRKVKIVKKKKSVKPTLTRKIKLKARVLSAPPELISVLLPENVSITIETVANVSENATVLHERTIFVNQAELIEPVEQIQQVIAQPEEILAPNLSHTLTEWFSANLPTDVSPEPEPTTAFSYTSYVSQPGTTPVDVDFLPACEEVQVVFQPNRQIMWRAATFAVLALFFVVPFQMFFWYDSWHQQAVAISATAGQTLEVAQNITQVLNTGDLQKIALELKNLSNSLTTLQKQYQETDPLLKFALRFSAKGRATRQLLDAASSFTQASQGLSNLVESMSQTAPENKKSGITIPFFANLVAQRETIVGAVASFRQGYKKIQQIEVNNLPDELKTYWPTALTSLGAVDKLLSGAFEQFNLWSEMFGQKNSQRYVLVFQNPHELRPTGGFWGGLAELNMKAGVIENFNFPGGGPYDLAGVSRVHVKPPTALQYINPEWQIQDANWYLDFPSSAEQFIWFYQKSGGPSLDGVIALSADILPELLALTGPIDMPAYKTIVTADNFYEVTQQQVEFLYDKTENKPKKFLGDLFEQLIPKVTALPSTAGMDLANLAINSLLNKDVMFYSTNAEVEQKLKQYRWAGEMVMGTGDYLALAQTNIGGSKSDAKILQNGSLTIRPDIQGVTETLEITRYHSGKKGQVLYGANNRTLWRVYLPREAHLISVEGAEEVKGEIYSTNLNLQEDPQLKVLEQTAQKFSDLVTITPVADKQEISFWQNLAPGEKKTFKLIYTTPRLLAGLEKNANWHSWYFQKQPGVKWQAFTYKLDLGQSANMAEPEMSSSFVEDWQKDPGLWQMVIPWSRDEWLTLKL